jgi:uncharacterized protein YukE
MGGTKFMMTDTALGTFGKSSTQQAQELEQALRNFVAAAEPMASSFQGAGRAAFDNFHAHGTEIAADLGKRLVAAIDGIGQMDTSFKTGDTNVAEGMSKGLGSSTYSGTSSH